MPEPWLRDLDFTLYCGDALDVLRDLDPESVDCVVTSPPYWGLRDYGTAEWEGGDEDCDHLKSAVRGDHEPKKSTLLGSKYSTKHIAQQELAMAAYRDVCGKCGAVRVDNQLGMEKTPGEFVANLVAIFSEIHRVLAPHGTAWLNLGDSYAPDHAQKRSKQDSLGRSENTGLHASVEGSKAGETRGTPDGLKPKDLVGIPWRTAFALQDAGWYLRSDIIWSKPNPMPESVRDRPTKAHEYIFLLTKSARYYFDQEAVREDAQWRRWGTQDAGKYADMASPARAMKSLSKEEIITRFGSVGRNVRTVWEIATEGYAGAHFAVFPQDLAARCITAGCPEWVCQTCGKPRVRVVEKHERESADYPSYDGQGRRGNIPGDNGVNALRKKVDGGSSLARYERRSTGWSDCGHDNYRQGVVLDPFLGSGTTAYVARAHARHAVGIELKPDHCEQIVLRTQQLSLLAV